MSTTYKQVVLKSRPEKAVTDSTFAVETAAVPSLPKGEKGYVLVKVKTVSLEPAMKGSMSERKSYRPPAPLNQVFWAIAYGEVVASSHDSYQTGQLVFGNLGAREYALLNLNDPMFQAMPLQKIDASKGLDPRAYLSAFGAAGPAAYFGLMEVAKLKKGENVLVSSAAGATGSFVIQMAKIVGAAKIIGIAGGKEKCDWVKKLGADDCIDYRSTDFGAQLQTATNEEIDVYFDNVGGEVLDQAILNMRRFGRIALCGQISEYNVGSELRGIRNMTIVLSQCLRMQGFIVMSEFWDKEVFANGLKQLAQWVTQGQIKTECHIYPKKGIEHFSAALQDMFAGSNIGKMMVDLE